MNNPYNPGGAAPPGWIYDENGNLVPDPRYQTPGAPLPTAAPTADSGPPTTSTGPSGPNTGTPPPQATPPAGGTYTGPGGYEPGGPNDPAAHGNGAAANKYLLNILNGGTSGGNYGSLVDTLNSQFGLPSGSGFQWYPDKKVIAASGGGYYAPVDPNNLNGQWAYNVGDSGGGTGGVGNGSAPTPWVWPQYNPPGFVPQVAPTAPPPFQYKDFTAPTLAEAQAKPGYQFGLQQGLGAYETAAASKGLARGGGTLKGLFDYANAAAEQNYGNVYAQDANTYTTNLNKEAGAYATNWGVTKDITTAINQANQLNYTDAFTNTAAKFNAEQAQSQLSFTDMYNRWLATLNANLHIFDQGGS